VVTERAIFRVNLGPVRPVYILVHAAVVCRSQFLIWATTSHTTVSPGGWDLVSTHTYGWPGARPAAGSRACDLKQFRTRASVESTVPNTKAITRWLIIIGY
jgi:hypothetical protein